MQSLKLFVALIVYSSFLYGCSGNAPGAGKDSSSVTSPKSDAASSNANPSTGDASFSCKIDGKGFSGKGTDQIVNATSVHSPGVIYFSLSSNFTGDPGADMRAGGIGFEVPDKGTTVIRGEEDPRYSVAYALPNDPTNTYRCKEMTVTINSSGARVTGTFSGTLIEPKTSREVPVTDGKFDLPYSTYSQK